MLKLIKLSIAEPLDLSLELDSPNPEALEKIRASAMYKNVIGTNNVNQLIIPYTKVISMTDAAAIDPVIPMVNSLLKENLPAKYIATKDPDIMPINSSFMGVF
jgi:hypothetical protein